MNQGQGGSGFSRTTNRKGALPVRDEAPYFLRRLFFKPAAHLMNGEEYGFMIFELSRCPCFLEKGSGLQGELDRLPRERVENQEKYIFLYLTGKGNLTGDASGYKIQVEEAGKGLQ